MIICHSSNICMVYCVLRFAYPPLFQWLCYFTFVKTLGINVCLFIYHLNKKCLNSCWIKIFFCIVVILSGHFTLIGFMIMCGCVYCVNRLHFTLTWFPLEQAFSYNITFLPFTNIIGINFNATIYFRGVFYTACVLSGHRVLLIILRHCLCFVLAFSIRVFCEKKIFLTIIRKHLKYIHMYDLRNGDYS